MPADLQATLDFIRELHTNNNTEWFHAHRKDYEAARDAFERLTETVLVKFSRVMDVGNIRASDAIHRINRDIRFSADKSPYKREMSALLGAEGRKSIGRAFYFQVAPDGESMVAAGAFSLEPDELQRIREAIAADSKTLRSILATDEFKRIFGNVHGDQVKTAPKGFPKDHPDLDLLRYKEFMADHRFTDAEVLSDTFAEQVVDVCEALNPFILYFDGVLGPRVKHEPGKH